MSVCICILESKGKTRTRVGNIAGLFKIADVTPHREEVEEKTAACSRNKGMVSGLVPGAKTNRGCQLMQGTATRQ